MPKKSLTAPDKKQLKWQQKQYIADPATPVLHPPLNNGDLLMINILFGLAIMGSLGNTGAYAQSNSNTNHYPKLNPEDPGSLTPSPTPIPPNSLPSLLLNPYSSSSSGATGVFSMPTSSEECSYYNWAYRTVHLSQFDQPSIYEKIKGYFYKNNFKNQRFPITKHERICIQPLSDPDFSQRQRAINDGVNRIKRGETLEPILTCWPEPMRKDLLHDIKIHSNTKLMPKITKYRSMQHSFAEASKKPYTMRINKKSVYAQTNNKGNKLINAILSHSENLAEILSQYKGDLN